MQKEIFGEIGILICIKQLRLLSFSSFDTKWTICLINKIHYSALLLRKPKISKDVTLGEGTAVTVGSSATGAFSIRGTLPHRSEAFFVNMDRG